MLNIKTLKYKSTLGSQLSPRGVIEIALHSKVFIVHDDVRLQIGAVVWIQFPSWLLDNTLPDLGDIYSFSVWVNRCQGYRGIRLSVLWAIGGLYSATALPSGVIILCWSMDPLSITTGVLSVLGVCLKVSVELKKFRDAANEGKATATAMLVDLSALRRVLQSMEEIFDQLDVEAIATGCIGTHWQNLLTSLRDGHDALEQFETLLQNCNKEVVVLDRARRAIRLKEAADSIAEFRQQIQSYKDTLQISVQTVIL